MAQPEGQIFLIGSHADQQNGNVMRRTLMFIPPAYPPVSPVRIELEGADARALDACVSALEQGAQALMSELRTSGTLDAARERGDLIVMDPLGDKPTLWLAEDRPPVPS